MAIHRAIPHHLMALIRRHKAETYQEDVVEVVHADEDEGNTDTPHYLKEMVLAEMPSKLGQISLFLLCMTDVTVRLCFSLRVHIKPSRIRASYRCSKCVLCSSPRLSLKNTFNCLCQNPATNSRSTFKPYCLQIIEIISLLLLLKNCFLSVLYSPRVPYTLTFSTFNANVANLLIY